MITVKCFEATEAELKSSSTHGLYGTSISGFDSVLTDKTTKLSYHFSFDEEVFHCNANAFIPASSKFDLGVVCCGSRGIGLSPNNFAFVELKNDNFISLRF